MPRTPRKVIPHAPHHVTQRGNRSQQTFFCDEDYKLYIALMSRSCQAHDVEIWAYCLMPNHVHLVAVPSTESGLHKAIGTANERYAKVINQRYAWQGHLWQGRFFSNNMDEYHLCAAVRYVEQNPVRARMLHDAGDYRWSSAPAHLRGADDTLVRVAPMLLRFPDWAAFIGDPLNEFDRLRIRKHSRSGRPLAVPVLSTPTLHPTDDTETP